MRELIACLANSREESFLRLHNSITERVISEQVRDKSSSRLGTALSEPSDSSLSPQSNRREHQKSEVFNAAEVARNAMCRSSRLHSRF